MVRTRPAARSETARVSQKGNLGIACAIGNTPLVPLDNLNGNPRVKYPGETGRGQPLRLGQGSPGPLYDFQGGGIRRTHQRQDHH